MYNNLIYIGWLYYDKEVSGRLWFETRDETRTKIHKDTAEEMIEYLDDLAGCEIVLIPTALGLRVGVPE